MRLRLTSGEFVKVVASSSALVGADLGMKRSARELIIGPRDSGLIWKDGSWAGDPGAVVLLERPFFLGVEGTYRFFGPGTSGIPVGSRGGLQELSS